MYLKFYGLREEPFGVTPDPRFLCATPTYQEAQATLEYGIRSGRGFTALIARPGMGKTTLLFHLLERYSRVARTAFIFLTQCDSREFMRYLMSELGTNTGETDFVRLQEQFGQLLVREAQAGKRVIAVVDEAQNLDVNVLETVRLLSDFETPRAKLLHIILTGQPELADRLASPALLQLRQRISHLVRLDPLSADEVNRYIDHRLRLAGYTGATLFTAEARAVIAQRSEGIPRTINNLCFNALSLACALQRRSIGADLLAEVSADLDFEGLRTQQEEAEEAASQRAAAPAAPATSRPQARAEPARPISVAEQKEETRVKPATVEEAATAAATKGANNGAPQRVTWAPASAEAPGLRAAATADEVHAADDNLQREEPASLPLPGPVLVPDPTPLPAEACKTDEVAKAEGNLALRIMPAEASGKPTAPMNGTGQPATTAPQLSSTPSAAPANGAAPAAAAEKAKSAVDVEALAADCALFGMEAHRRWKRPTGRTPAPPGAAAPRPGAPTPASLRTNVPRSITAQMPTPAAVTPAKAGPVNGSTAVPAGRPGQAGSRMPVKSGPGKLWSTRPVAAAINARKRRRQRSVLVAAGASLLLLLLLIWLLGTGAPSTSQAAEGNAAEQNANQKADSSSSGGGAAAPSDSSVVDVVQDLPRPGNTGVREAPPAVVMRGTRAGEQLVRRVDPVYPAAAQANRIQGPVVLEATIGTHGFLRHIRVVSGNPLLADSVLDAVRGWRYRPHTEHGRAVETETRIVVNFQLRSTPGGSSQNP
jgi:general secretion pathway protein A